MKWEGAPSATGYGGPGAEAYTIWWLYTTKTTISFIDHHVNGGPENMLVHAIISFITYGLCRVSHNEGKFDRNSP